jgi:hypothetical protein
VAVAVPSGYHVRARTIRSGGTWYTSEPQANPAPLTCNSLAIETSLLGLIRLVASALGPLYVGCRAVLDSFHQCQLYTLIGVVPGIRLVGWTGELSRVQPAGRWSLIPRLRISIQNPGNRLMGCTIEYQHTDSSKSISIMNI